MKDKLSKARRSWNMAQIKGKNTKPEIIVRSILHRMGYRFRLHVKNLPVRPEIVLPKYKPPSSSTATILPSAPSASLALNSRESKTRMDHPP